MTQQNPGPSWKLWRHKSGFFTTRINAFTDSQLVSRLQNPTYIPKDFVEVHPTKFRFVASLQFKGIDKHASATFFDMERTGSFSMSQNEFEKVLKTCQLSNGCIRGLWRFEKHGHILCIYLEKEILSDEEEETLESQFNYSPEK